ncbi:hypothetical protein ACOSQ2_017894 [Xanthoceras sorbifolium]
MEALRASSFPSINIPKALHEYRTHFTTKPNFMNFLTSCPIPCWSFSSSTYNKKNTPRPFKVFTISSPPPSSSAVSTENAPPPPEPELETESKDEKFDWFSEWYPVMPVCELDERVPHGKKVLGLDIVVWWDKNENAWKVFDDACPHRLAPLSDGRIDKLGRLQCAYHGWCFNGAGDCKLIPQAPPDGPQVHTFKKACARAYPSIVQHEMVWFWPNTDPEYKDIITKKKPPFIPEMDDLFLGITSYTFHVLFHIHGFYEQKIMEVGSANWHKACFVPTKSDAFVVGFRKWLNKYSDGQINWGAGKFSSGTLPPAPPREQLMDRYWSHVVNCRSCSCAYKSLNALEVILQVISIVSIGIATATKQSEIPVTARTVMVSMAVIGFATSRWLAHFIYKNFHYHDYDHTQH